MTSPVRLWTCAAHHSIFRCGGWAWLREAGGAGAAVTGAAGGERNTSAQRMALTGLVGSLGGLPPADARPISLYVTGPELAGLERILAGATPGGGADADQDLDLWARILTAAKGRRFTVIPVSVQPATPMAFAAAWAELGMDKAKATGAFTAAIPRPNLAKIQGL